MTPLHITPDQKLQNYFDFQQVVYQPLEQTATANKVFDLGNTSISPLTGRKYTPSEMKKPVETVAKEVASTEESKKEDPVTFVTYMNKYSNVDNRGNITSRPTYESPVSPTEGSLLELSKKGIGGAESTNNYKAHRWDTGKNGTKGSGAWGKYQFIAKWHKDNIKKVTGKNMDDFLKSPDSQERYYEWHFENTLLPQLQKLRQEGLGGNLTDLEIVGGLHFAGLDKMRKALSNNQLSAKLNNNPSIRKHIDRVLKYAAS